MKTLKQVEKLTGIKAATLRQQLKRKMIEGIKFGRDWALTEETIEYLIRKNATTKEQG